MTRFLLTISALALMSPVGSAAPAPANGSKTTIFPFPAKAPIVVCLNGYDKARDRLNKLATAALPDDAPGLMKTFDDQLNKLLEGRKLTAVRKDARAFLVVNDLGGIMQGSVPVSGLVPVTSYKEFRETFFTKDEQKSFEKGKEGVDSIKTSATGDESTVYLVDLKEYVAVTPDKGVADAYAAKYTAGSTEPMGPEAADAFLKGDVALYVNMDAINDQLGDQIRQARGFIDLLTQQFQQGAMSKKQVEAMKTFLKGMFQAVEDCRALVAAAEFRPDGLLVRVQARFAENTASSKLIQSEPSSPLKEIGKLPAGLSVYNQSRLGDTLSNLMREANLEFAAPDDDDAAAGKIDAALKDRTKAGPRGEWSAGKNPNVTITISDYKEPAAAGRAILKAYKAVPAGGRIAGTVLKTAPKVKEKAQQEGGFTFDEIQLHYDFEATVAILPEQVREATLETLKKSSSEKTTVWLGTDGKVLLQMTGKDWASTKPVLAEYLEGKSVSKDLAFAATRAALPTDASQIVVAETASTISSLVDGIKTGIQSAPIPGLPQFGAIKPVKGGTPTFVGFAVTLKGDSVGMTAYVPTGAIAVARKMFEGFE